MVLFLQHRAQQGASKIQGYYRDRWPRRTFIRCPDGIWARKFDTILSVPASPQSRVVGSCSDKPCATVFNSFQTWGTEILSSKYSNTFSHKESRQVSLNYRSKKFPQTSIHWLFHWISWLYLESPLLSAGHSSPVKCWSPSVLHQL